MFSTRHFSLSLFFPSSSIGFFPFDPLLSFHHRCLSRNWNYIKGQSIILLKKGYKTHTLLSSLALMLFPLALFNSFSLSLEREADMLLLCLKTLIHFLMYIQSRNGMKISSPGYRIMKQMPSFSLKWFKCNRMENQETERHRHHHHLILLQMEQRKREFEMRKGTSQMEMMAKRIVTGFSLLRKEEVYEI